MFSYFFHVVLSSTGPFLLIKRPARVDVAFVPPGSSESQLVTVSFPGTNGAGSQNKKQLEISFKAKNWKTPDGDGERENCWKKNHFELSCNVENSICSSPTLAKANVNRSATHGYRVVENYPAR